MRDHLQREDEEHKLSVLIRGIITAVHTRKWAGCTTACEYKEEFTLRLENNQIEPSGSISLLSLRLPHPFEQTPILLLQLAGNRFQLLPTISSLLLKGLLPKSPLAREDGSLKVPLQKSRKLSPPKRAFLRSSPPANQPRGVILCQ